MDLFLLSGLRFDSCTASYPSTVHMTLENELHGATLIPMHRDSKTVKKNLPPQSDLQQRQAVPRPASRPEQGEIEKSIKRL